MTSKLFERTWEDQVDPGKLNERTHLRSTEPWAQFNGSAFRKHRIGAYGSREFCAYGKRISRVSGKFGLLRLRTPRY